MTKYTLMRKRPRDLVSIDEFWEADSYWPQYFIRQQVWVFVDEYNAELSGDEDYCRIIIHSSSVNGWLYSRRLQERELVHLTLAAIATPVSEKQLKSLGFIRWKDSYL